MSARALAIATIVTAVIALVLPWLTHFADGGASLLALLLWAGFLVTTIATYRVWWLLLTAPVALFWPVVVLLVADDLILSF
jgi:hypothetical protein